MAVLEATEIELRQETSPEVFHRGEEYFQRGAVEALVRRGDRLEADVRGSDVRPYRVGVPLTKGGLAVATCTCPYEWGGCCKHIVATVLAALREPERIEARPPLADLLAGLDRAQLQTLVLKLAETEPWLVGVIEAQVPLLAAAPEPAAAAPASAGAGPARAAAPTAVPPPIAVDPPVIRQQIQAALRGLGRRRYWDDYGYGSPAIDAMAGPLEQAQRLIEAGDGRTALAVLEAITEEYVPLWEMLAESDEEVLPGLGETWTEALLTADLTAEERQAWTAKLEDWQGAFEDYGIDTLDTALAAAKQGWDYPPLQRVLRGEITERGAWADEAPYYADELAQTRLRVLERQGRYQEYLNLAEAEGQDDRYAAMLARLGRGAEAVEYGRQYLTTALEARTVAQALWEAGDRERALELAEHGLALEAPKAPLAMWLRDRAAEQGQRERALKAARAVVADEPTLADYLKVQALAGDDWPAQQAQLLKGLRKIRSYYPEGPVAIFLHEGLIADAIAAVDQGATHTLVEQVVDAATASHPDWAIATSRKQAEGIMDEGKAQYYGAAARWLAKARAAYHAAGHVAEWQAYLADLLERHHRKYKLVPLLKALG